MPPPNDPLKYDQWIANLSKSHKGHIPWNKGIPQTDEVKRKLSEGQLGEKHWNYGGHHKPETIEKMSKASKGRKMSPASRKKLSESRMGKYTGKNNPFFGKHHTPEMMAHLIEKRKQQVHSELTRLKQSEAHRAEKSHLWKGGVSFEPYCPKFSREFKERVRAFFGYTCIWCGTPQNGRKLGVHHVDYNKNTCCDNSIPLFVPLCESCHSKTGFKERAIWMQHFTDLINTYYGGKCYLSKQEMKALVGGGDY
jgi:hypothetical protein